MANRATLAIAVLAGVLVGFGAAPARAAVPEMTVDAALGATAAPTETEFLISTDGVHFSTTASVALFDNLGTVVPLDTEVRSIWVRNPIAVPVQTRVSISDIATTSLDFAQNVTLTSADTEGGSTITRTLADLARCDVVIGSRILGPNATVRFDLSVSMLDVPEKIAQNQDGNISFLVGMRDGEAGPFPPKACDDVTVISPPATPPGLVTTGAELPYDWFVVSAALVGFGLLLLARRRRERSEES